MRAAYTQGDFFILQTYLEDSIPARAANGELQIFRAATHNFFNRLDDSEREITRYYSELDAKEGNDTLRFDLLRLQLDNALKQQRFADALALCDTLTQKYEKFWTADAIQSLKRLKPIVEAVGKVVPMTCEKKVDTELTIGYDKQQHPKIPVMVGKFSDEFSLDLSTQFCMVSQTAAKHLELKALQGSFEAQSTLGNLTQASIAVANELRIGSATLRNVPFLVFPDKAMLLRGDSTPVHGTLGYGLLAALQEVVFTGENRLLIPKTAPSESKNPNFGLIWYTPILKTTVNGQPIPMLLDLSLRRSALALKDTQNIGGTYQSRAFLIGKQTVKMDSLRTTLSGTRPNFWQGTFGRDLIHQVKALRINFKTMQVDLE